MLKIQVFPNPNDGRFVVKFHLNKIEDVKITLSNTEGKVLEERILTNLNVGENTFQRKVRGLEYGGVYFITVESASDKVTQKIIIED
jgi:hypothetical protein